jgi:hypothetical protein
LLTGSNNITTICEVVCGVQDSEHRNIVIELIFKGQTRISWL